MLMCHVKRKPAEPDIVATLNWPEQQAPCGCEDVLQPNVVGSHKRWGWGGGFPRDAVPMPSL